MTLRARTIDGEKLMQATIERAMSDLDACEDELQRSYAATALLMVAMTELTAGVPLDTAIETAHGVLRELQAKAM